MPITCATGLIARSHMPISPHLLPWEVLVVDDDEDVRDLIVSHFNRRRVPVVAAQDGLGAIAALERSAGRIGMVVTDLELPGADGFSVLEVAKRVNPSCYVVIITGYASLDSALLAVRGGAYDYLPKPFSLGQLDVILQRISDRAALEEENRRLVQHDRRALQGDVHGRTLALERLAGIEAALARIEAGLADLARSTPLRP